MRRIAPSTAVRLEEHGVEVEHCQGRGGVHYFVKGGPDFVCYICGETKPTKESTGPFWDENEAGELEPHPMCIECWLKPDKYLTPFKERESE